MNPPSPGSDRVGVRLEPVRLVAERVSLVHLDRVVGRVVFMDVTVHGALRWCGSV